MKKKSQVNPLFNLFYIITHKFHFFIFFPGLSLSTSCRGLLVSCSNDGVIKIWDIDQESPILIWEQTSNLGAIQCLAANPDNGFVFTVGGDNKEHNFKVLDLIEIPTGM